jgi:outer membrane lipoprotein-sorting protein
MRTLLVALLCAAGARCQPALTAEQILEKSIEASGGRALIARLTSTYASGLIEFVNAEAHGKVEMYAKAPNRQLVINTLEGVGEIRQGFDGQVAWSQDPSGAVQEATGAVLEQMKTAATFNAALKWREMYPKVERAGEDTVGGRSAYAVRLIPAAGKPETRYFDRETFLFLKESGTHELPGRRAVEISVEFSDYRDVGGIKVPFHIRQVMPPMGELRITLTEVKNNLELDESLFRKPTVAGAANPRQK